jgi:hypothetical protein
MAADDNRRPSYKPCGCGWDCPYDDNPAQPCWGETIVYEEMVGDEEWDMYHACEGHLPMSEGGGYKPEPTE